MVQDIFPHIFRNEFTNRPPKDGDFVLSFGPDGLLMDRAAGIRLPTVAEARALGAEGLQFLFAEDDADFFLSDKILPAGGGFAYVDSRAYRGMGPQEVLFACAVGESLARWYRSNRFCGSCGVEMDRSEGERAMKCPACGHTVYPKICPAVIAAVCDGDRLLLTKYAGRGFSRYALVAGFAEIGESIEDTVRREVMEEVGLKLGELRFYKSQPWVFTDTLLMGFYARLDGPGTVRLQEDELALAEWFSRDDLPEEHSGISLTGEMIEVFRAGQDPFSFPK